ncbi:MAG: glycoside hydrolase family 95-like protein, partial [bacterium]
RVFPATPSSWKDASFYQLRTEGAFLVSAKRENGKTTFLHIKSFAGEPCIIQSDMSAEVKVIGIPSHRLQHKNGKIILDLKKGEEAVLYKGPKPPIFVIDAMPMTKENMNQWGLKRIIKQ